MPKPFALPGSEIHYARDCAYAITHTRLDIQLNFEDRSIDGSVTHEIIARSSTNKIELDAAEIVFSKVAVNGIPAKFEVEPMNIRILLEKAIEPGDRASVRIDYHAKPRVGLHFRGPDASHPARFLHAFTSGLLLEDPMYYFPCYNYPNMRMTSEILITIPSRMVAIASGKLLSVSESSAGKKTWHFEMNSTHVTDVLTFAAGEYVKLEERLGDVILEYYVPSGKEEEARRTFQNTQKMMKFFSKATGMDYPFPKYAQVVVSDFYNGGMEHITATTLTDETLHDERAELDFTSDDLVSHELAHQWFGDLISLKDWSQAWLNEGFATYFNALYREHANGNDDLLYYMHSFIGPIKDEFSKHYMRAITTKLYADSHELYDSHTYLKGAWFLHGIRGLLGDETFWNTIKHYVKKNKGKIVEASDFRKVLEFVSGLDLERHFEEWLEKPGYPIYNASYSWSDEENKATLNIEQSNAGGNDIPIFSNPIAVKFSFDESSMTETIRMKERSMRFQFFLPSEPLNVSIDPCNWILKEISFEKPGKMYLYQLANDKNLIERIRACEEIAKWKKDEIVRALASVFESNSHWSLKVEAAKALGKIGTESAFKELTSRLRSGDHHVRRGVAEGLGEFAGSKLEDDAIGSAIGLLENDVSFQVRASAASALSSYKSSTEVRSALRRAITQDSYNDIVRSSVFKSLSEIGDSESLQSMIDYFNNGQRHQGRIAAASGIGNLGKNSVNTLEVLFAARHFQDARIRMEAASTIEKFGRNADRERLRAWLAVEQEGRVRRRLRETVFAIEARGA